MKAQELKPFIEKLYGTQRAFAAAQGVKRPKQQVEWLEAIDSAIIRGQAWLDLDNEES